MFKVKKHTLRSKVVLLLALFLYGANVVTAQVTFPYNGVNDPRDDYYAFTNATIYISYQQKVEKATLLIRKGKVEAVGTGISIPPSAVVVDLEGRYIYPSFIDLYASYGLPKPESIGTKKPGTPQMLSNKKGAYAWNEALRPEVAAQDQFTTDTKDAGEWREIGFGAVLSHQMDGISRGFGCLVLTGEEREHENIVVGKAAHILSFSKGKSTQDYPSSLMGCIALLRQTYLDAQWYQTQGQKEERNLSLEAWNNLQQLPQIFVVGDKQEALRAARIGKEFGVRYILKGKGDEYQRVDELKALGMPFIVPISFPKAFDVEDPYDALHTDLADLKHWELAPENPARLARAGFEFALTADGHEKKEGFLMHLRQAVKAGLNVESALKALTYTPAQLLGVSDQLGSLEKGKVANFIITSDDFFTTKAKIYQHWVNGKGYPISGWETQDINGTYLLRVDDQEYTLKVSGTKDKTEMLLQQTDSTTIKVKNDQEKEVINLAFIPPGEKGKVALSGVVNKGNWKGRGTLPDGRWVSWEAVQTEKNTIPTPEKKEKETPPILGQVSYPFMAYGWTQTPIAEECLVRNATVWTNEADGILENTDVLFKKGKIEKIGKNLNAGNAKVIDGTGKHLTCGIIDEHSHIAISRGVNEGTQASSAEVRIGDVVNAEDINIYRQLAGGVTTSQLLHGSANPIGGQSALIKLRWGYEAEAMKLEGADGFIKFALGENVKQSNWGDGQVIRFPQTRMGVEQVFIDHFTRAQDYGKLKQSGQAYRRDLELDALLEVINKKRFITCHSYQQGEINMLMKVAERFGFRINTFTHILEGYKVADKMKAHGVGGSTFSDWWGYKYEVIDAIPYNGPIMHDQGVVVAYNSDDAEMARRLNQEAAKAVMYSGLSEEEAWKFVTLNPAKLLHIDHRVGSIKVGKDADLVLWSDNPLSVYAHAESTWVDGIRFFDLEKDRQLRQEIQTERARLIQRMIEDDSPGGKSGPPEQKDKELYHCDYIKDEMH